MDMTTIEPIIDIYYGIYEGFHKRTKNDKKALLLTESFVKNMITPYVGNEMESGKATKSCKDDIMKLIFEKENK